MKLLLNALCCYRDKLILFIILLFFCSLQTNSQDTSSFFINNKIPPLYQGALNGTITKDVSFATLPAGITVQPMARTNSATCNTSTFYMHLSAFAGQKIELKDVQTLPWGNFILVGNITPANSTVQEGMICNITNSGAMHSNWRIRINDKPVTFFALKVLADGKILIAGILHDVTDKAVVVLMNTGLSTTWIKIFDTPLPPVKVTLDLTEFGQVAVAAQLPSSVICSMLNVTDGSTIWSKQINPAGLDEVAGFTQMLFEETGLVTNCTRGGQKVVEITRISHTGNVISSHIIGNGTEEKEYQRTTVFNNRLNTIGIVQKTNGQYELVRNILSGSSTVETEHRYTIPGNVDFNTSCAFDNAADVMAFFKPVDSKLVFLRHLASDQTLAEHTRQYTVPQGSSVGGVARSFKDGGFLLGMNTVNATELILIKTDSVGILAGCNYETLTNNSTETINTNNTASATTGADITLSVLPGQLSAFSGNCTWQFDCNQNYCPPPPADDTCLASYYKVLRSNSHADVFGNYYLLRNNQHIAITARYDRILETQNQLTYGVKLFDERGDFIKGVQVFCDGTSVPLLSRQVDDHRIMLISYTVSSDGQPQYTFTLINDDLQIIWSKTVRTFTGYNFSSSALMGDLVSDAEGNFYFVGNNLGFNENPKVMAYKMDPNGNPLWLKIHVFPSNLLFFTIAATTTHSSLVMVVEGSTTGCASLRLDKNTGQRLNAFVYQNRGAGSIYKRHLRFDHDRIFYAGNDGNTDLVIGLFDTTGSPMKLKYRPNSSLVRAATSGSSMMYVMYNYFTGSGYKDVLLKVDSTLAVQFSNEFDITLTGYPVGLAVGDNGGIYAGGNFFYGGSFGYSDPFIRKFEPTGSSGTCDYQTSTAPFIDINLNTLAVPTIETTQSFTPITLPVTFIADTNGQRISSMVCSSVSGCDTIVLSGPAVVCGMNQVNTYLTNKTPGCTLRPLWIYDTAFVTIQNITDATADIIFKQTGSTWIKVRLNTGCKVYWDSLLIQIQDSPAAFSLGNDQPLCNYDTLKLSAGNGFDTYLWQDGSTDSTFTATTPGEYYVEATNLCGNRFTDTIRLLPVTVPVLNIGIDSPVCKNDTLYIQAQAGFNTYNWQSSSGLINGQGQQVYIVPLQNTAITLEAITAEGCEARDTLQVTSIEARPVSLGNDTSFCISDSIRLNAGAGYLQYNWNNGSNAQTITAYQQGTYHIAVTDLNGCIARDTLNVLQVFALPAFNLGNDFDLCVGDQKQLDPGNFNQYAWHNGSVDRYFTVSAPGQYWVKVTDVNQCSSSDTAAMIKILPVPSGFLKAVDSICRYDQITIHPLSNYNSYNWSTGSSQSSITVDAPGLYSLEVRDGNGCTGKDSIEIVQKNCYTGLYIPTAFTPNRDNLNDVFMAKVYGVLLSFRLEVYNRNGERVFMTTNPIQAWNGQLGGVDQPTGVFVWQCFYQFAGRDVEYQKGVVTLIR